MVRTTEKKKNTDDVANPLFNIQLALSKLEYRVNTLEKQVQRIENKQISEWKIVKIVFIVLSALAGVIGLVLHIINNLPS